jgi:agmatine/peptidylarginine deiminase
MPRLPAEWEPQWGVMLTWPHAETDWAEHLDEVEAVYDRIAALIAARESVLIICRDQEHRNRIAGRLATAGLPSNRLRLAIAPSNDTWARDHGPVCVLGADGTAELVDFRFNGWGGKYPADKDDRITARLHAAGCFGDAELVSSPLVLEGGAIDTDGVGTLLAVRRTLVDPARNRGWTEEQIETELRARLGSERILWLEHGQLSGDDTDGHIDTLARFCDPATICYVQSQDRADADHAELSAMEQELRALRRADGRPYRLIPLPQPAPILTPDGRRLPATHANFLIIDGAVLVPVYDDPTDQIALSRLRDCFSDRKVLPVDCRALIRQGGSLHCITMQLPAALSPTHQRP